MAIYSGFTHWKWWFPIVMLIYRRVCCLHHQYYERRTSRKTATSPWGSDSANVQLGASRSLLDAVQMSLGARGDVFWGRQGWIKLEITMVITPVSWDITPISVYIYIYVRLLVSLIIHISITSASAPPSVDRMHMDACQVCMRYPAWWFGTWMDYDFPSYWECHRPNWL